MGFHVEINSILRSDESYPLARGSEHDFQKDGSRVFFDTLPIWLTKSDWMARAEIRVISQTRTPESVKGRFRVLHVYEGAAQETLTVAFRRMFAAGDDPFIYLMMSPADYDRVVAAGEWAPADLPKVGFVHASPQNQLTRVANKYYAENAEVRIVLLRHEKVRPEIRWEPATGGLYPHVYGPINMNAAERVVTVRKGADGKFAIGPEQFLEPVKPVARGIKLQPETAPAAVVTTSPKPQPGSTSMNLATQIEFLRKRPAAPVGPEVAEGEPPAASVSQKARANDLFLRGGLSSEELAKARATANGFEIVIGRSNLLPAIFLEAGAAHSKATCLIRTSGVDFRGRTGSWSGTGFLVSPNILLTNNHVLNSPAVAAAANAVFNYQIGVDGQPLPTTTLRLRPDRLYLSSPAQNGLDYTFCWVDGEPGREFGQSRLNRQAMAIAEQEFANIVSHPDGRMKEIAIQENTVEWQDELVVQYSSDTEPGSSGAAVCNNNWQLIALHHASKETGIAETPYRNEGIKLSSIAIDLERIANSGTAAATLARELLALFGGTDERVGFFGALGRSASTKAGLEAVVDTFSGTEQDIDVGFWNVEWLTRRYEEKAAAVAQVIHALNLDVWSLEESSEEAAKAVAAELQSTFNKEFGVLAAEPGVEGGKQSCTILWNKETVTVEPEEWGDTIETWLRARSTDFDDLGLGGFEAVQGKIFDRYPALFKVTSNLDGPNGHRLTFFLIPLHLKAMDEGSMRRKMASKILAAAIAKKIEAGAGPDFIVGGDANAELGTGDFDNLTAGGLTAVSAADEQGGAFSYIKRPKSLIDHIFLSPNLARRFDDSDYFIVAAERNFPDFVAQISDHRPVLLRMSLGDVPESVLRPEVAGGIDHKKALDELRERLKLKPAKAVIKDTIVIAAPKKQPGVDLPEGI